MTDARDRPKFQIFRVNDAQSLEETGNMSLPEFTPEQLQGMADMYGPEGVELLEFRHATTFDFKLLASGEAFWKRAADTARARSAEWREAKLPPLNH